jgi:hypothetical protein
MAQATQEKLIIINLARMHLEIFERIHAAQEYLRGVDAPEDEHRTLEEVSTSVNIEVQAIFTGNYSFLQKVEYMCPIFEAVCQLRNSDIKDDGFFEEEHEQNWKMDH